MTQRELDRLLRLWQRRLKLTDWTIEVKFVPLSTMDEVGDRGEVVIFAGKQVASIKLVDPSHHGHEQADRLGLVDTEIALVHELLHIRCASWQPRRGTAKHIAHEQAIHAISMALLGR